MRPFSSGKQAGSIGIVFLFEVGDRVGGMTGRLMFQIVETVMKTF